MYKHVASVHTPRHGCKSEEMKSVMMWGANSNTFPSLPPSPSAYSICSALINQERGGKGVATWNIAWKSHADNIVVLSKLLLSYVLPILLQGYTSWMISSSFVSHSQLDVVPTPSVGRCHHVTKGKRWTLLAPCPYVTFNVELTKQLSSRYRIPRG